MSNQITYLNQLSKTQRMLYKKALTDKGKSICNGNKCKGKIKPLSHFTKMHNGKCTWCEQDDINVRNAQTLKFIYMKVKCDRKFNRDTIKIWKCLTKSAKCF